MKVSYLNKGIGGGIPRDAVRGAGPSLQKSDPFPVGLLEKVRPTHLSGSRCGRDENNQPKAIKKSTVSQHERGERGKTKK